MYMYNDSYKTSYTRGENEIKHPVGTSVTQLPALVDATGENTDLEISRWERLLSLPVELPCGVCADKDNIHVYMHINL